MMLRSRSRPGHYLDIWLQLWFSSRSRPVHGLYLQPQSHLRSRFGWWLDLQLQLQLRSRSRPGHSLDLWLWPWFRSRSRPGDGLDLQPQLWLRSRTSCSLDLWLRLQPPTLAKHCWSLPKNIVFYKQFTLACKVTITRPKCWSVQPWKTFVTATTTLWSLGRKAKKWDCGLVLVYQFPYKSRAQRVKGKCNVNLSN